MRSGTFSRDLDMTATASQRLRRKLEKYAELPDDDDIAELDAELESILDNMAGRKTYEEAKPDLDELAELHGLMATLLFKHRVELSSRQQYVVRTFDRWDDEDTRRYFYAEVVAGRR